MKAAAVMGVLPLVLGIAAKASAAGLAYVRASSQLEASTNRGRYHPLNLLDDDPSTLWCEAAGGGSAGESVEIVFKRKQRIDRIAVNPAFRTGRLVEAVRVSDGLRSITLTIAAGPAVEVLSPPLEGTTYMVSIEKVGAPAATAEAGGPAGAACVADVLLYWRNHPFGGNAGRLRFDARLDKVAGTWQGGPFGAPEQLLVLALDGTWEWTYTPLLGGKPKRLAGEYRFQEDRLLMRQGEVGRWSDMRIEMRRVRIDPAEPGAPKGDYDVLTLGRALGQALAGEYNNARF